MSISLVCISLHEIDEEPINCCCYCSTVHNFQTNECEIGSLMRVTVENQPLVSLELPVLAFCRAAKADGIAIEVAVPLLFFSFGPETGCFGRRMFDCRFRQKQLIETKYLCFAWLPTEPIFRGCREVAQNGCQ